MSLYSGVIVQQIKKICLRPRDGIIINKETLFVKGAFMIKKVIILILGIILISSNSASADVWMKLACPSSVAVGAALKVTVKAFNGGSTIVNLSRYAAGIVGNYNNALGTARVYGPYAKTITVKTVPACTVDGNGQWVADGTVSFSVPVISAVPADLKGKMAFVVVNFINSSGQSITGDSCLVNVP